MDYLPDTFTFIIPKTFKWDLAQARSEYFKGFENFEGKRPKELTFTAPYKIAYGPLYEWRGAQIALWMITDVVEITAVDKTNIESILNFADFIQCDFILEKLFNSHVHRRESILQLWKFAKEHEENQDYKKFFESCVFYFKTEKGLNMNDLEYIINPYMKNLIHYDRAAEKFNRLLDDKERLWLNHRGDVNCHFCDQTIEYGSVVGVEKIICCGSLKHRMCDVENGEMPRLERCKICQDREIR